MRLAHALAGAVLLASAAPVLASSCSEEIATLDRRLGSAGAATVTGKAAPGGTTSSNSDKALGAPPEGKPSDPKTAATSGGVEEARDLVEKARAEEKAGRAEACRDTIMQAKEKAGALP